MDADALERCMGSGVAKVCASVTNKRPSKIARVLSFLLVAMAAAGLGAQNAQGQANVYTLWSGTYGDALYSNARASAIAGNGNGNAVVTGWACLDFACSDKLALTVQFDQGTIAWKDWLSSPANNASGVAAKLDAAGNAYVVYSLSLSTGADLALAKYNAAGVREWINYLRGGGGPSLQVSAAGNVYLCYQVASASDTNAETVFVDKYSTTGVLDWSNSPNLPGNTVTGTGGFGIDANEDVFVLVSGVEGSDEVFEYQTNGSLLRTFGANAPSSNAFDVDAAGNTYEAALINGSAFVTKFNPNGTLAWESEPNTAQIDNLSGIATDSAGDVILGATTEDQPPVSGDSNLSAIKLDSEGKFEWLASYNDHSYGSLAASYTVAMTANAEGEAYVYGVDANLGEPGNAGPIMPLGTLLVKYDSTGKVAWVSGANAPLQLTSEPVALAGYGGELLVLSNAVQPGVTGAFAQGSEWTPEDLVQDALKLSTNTLSFGTQKLGTASAAMSVVVTNTAETALQITPAVTGNTGSFRVTNNCPANIPGFGTCTLSVVFDPTAAGSLGVTIQVKDDWEGNAAFPQLVNVSGTGTN
jgi:Abnormal spindle-like microcephaly-assoc'd, ASPM-SPD-2-Hydin